MNSEIKKVLTEMRASGEYTSPQLDEWANRIEAALGDWPYPLSEVVEVAKRNAAQSDTAEPAWYNVTLQVRYAAGVLLLHDVSMEKEAPNEQ